VTIVYVFRYVFQVGPNTFLSVIYKKKNVTSVAWCARSMSTREHWANYIEKCEHSIWLDTV